MTAAEGVGFCEVPFGTAGEAVVVVVVVEEEEGGCGVVEILFDLIAVGYIDEEV
jgi:hypothetical protein